MNLRTRLQRLEQSVGPSPTAGLKPWSATAEEEQSLAYLRGEGPKPPCPAYHDPTTWDSQIRIECCLMQRTRGALGKGEYLPGMTDHERDEVDQLVKVIAQWDWAPPWFR